MAQRPRRRDGDLGCSVPIPSKLSRPSRILFLFLDGVGVGVHEKKSNPLVHATLGFFPLFREASGPSPVRRLLAEEAALHPLASSGYHTALDACLGVPGTPQSATGQATLFTGINCAKALGRHLTAFPNDALADIVRRENLLLKAARAGYQAAFLNTYTPRFYELGVPHSVSTLCALSLERPFFMLEEMKAGKALYHDITQESLRRTYGNDIPVFSPLEAGRWLANAAKEWQVALYEHFWTDRMGHKGTLDTNVAHVRKVEGFIAGVLEASDLNETLVVMGSDHGNIEDLETRGHTRNPVPFSAWGPGAQRLTEEVASLVDVTPALLELLT